MDFRVILQRLAQADSPWTRTLELLVKELPVKSRRYDNNPSEGL
jgi:hypothetical protein